MPLSRNLIIGTLVRGPVTLSSSNIISRVAPVSVLSFLFSEDCFHFLVLWVLYLMRCCYILFCNSMSFVIGDFLDCLLCHINRNGSLLVLHTRKFHLWYAEKIILKICFSLTVFAFFKEYSNRNLRISLRFLFVFFISRLNF